MMHEFLKSGSNGFDAYKVTMQSTSEAERFQRVFPNPAPTTHEYQVEWADDGFSFTIVLVPRVEALAAVRPLLDARRVADLIEGRRTALKKMSQKDLRTLLIEMNVNLAGSASKEEQIHAVISKAQEYIASGVELPYLLQPKEEEAKLPVAA